MKICVLCRKEFDEPGNDPWPLAKWGSCCNRCDDTKVTIARMGMWDFKKNEPTRVGKTIGEAMHDATQQLKNKLRRP